MKKEAVLYALVMAVMVFGFACQKEVNRDYLVRPVEFTKVKIMDDFLLPRIETNQKVTIPFAMQQNEETGRVDNFAIAGGLKEGEYRGRGTMTPMCIR